MTKDERFLIEIYRKCREEGVTINPEIVGQELGYSERLVKNILKGLMQSNLVKRYSPEEITLTSRGIQVVKTLLT